MKKEIEKGYEHFCYLILETKMSRYYVSTKGEAFRIDKSTNNQSKLTPSMHNGQARLHIHGLKNPELKRLVWKIAGRPLDKDIHIQCIDGNEMNCNIENLRAIPKKEAARVTGPMSRSRAVIIKKNGKEKEYRSVREAAKALYVSYQTLLDYLNRRYKSSVAKSRGVNIYYKEGDQ